MLHFTKKPILKTIAYTLFCLIGAGVLSIVSIFVYQHRVAFVSFTTMKPETFTELYFEDHTNLPTKSLQSNLNSFTNSVSISYSFRFTIHNLENRDMKYPYEVFMIGPNRVVIEKGEVFIKNNTNKTITEKYSMPDTFPATKVIVNLPEKNQSIAFWMEAKTK